ncbi:hypothetical protein ACFE04_009781 [Oxalis oulophora]
MDVWADIPTDIFFSICKRFVYEELIVASTVCKSWHSPCDQMLRIIPVISPKVPWLMLSEEDRRGLSNTNPMRTFFNLSTGKLFDLNLPDTINKKCVSVGFGWLFTIDINLQVQLFHPLTHRKFNLPRYSTFKEFDPVYHDNLKEPCKIPFDKAVASTDPWDQKIQDFNQDCVIMTTNGFGQAFAKLGDKTWTDIEMEDNAYYYEGVYHKSQYFVVCVNFLHVGNIVGHQVPFTNALAQLPLHLARYTNKYLVESAGELLVVFRHIRSALDDPNYTYDEVMGGTLETPYETNFFNVARLVKGVDSSGNYEYTFVEIKTLGGQALFVGRNASFSLHATRLNGLCCDCIYFTDDFEIYNIPKNGCGFDMGVYNLRDGTIERHYKGESRSDYSTPTWYI